MSGRATGLRRAMCLAVAGGVSAGSLAPLAQAQQVMITRGSIGGPMGGGSSKVSSKSVAAYSELLGLEPEQTEIAYALHEQYTISTEEAEKERRNAMQAVMAEFRETEDHNIMSERMPKIMEDFQDQSKAIEGAFFDDLRIMLDETQAARWDRVERMRRRETTLRQGSLSGETVDLIAMTKSVGGERDLGPDVGTALDQYEVELDRALVNKARALEQMQDATPGMTMTFDLAAMEEMGAKSREVGLRVRDLNKRHARLIESMLPEDLAPEFRDEMKRRSFPRVYRESRIDRMLGAAEGLDDLTDDQRTSLGEIRPSYVRDRGAADNRWAAAITDQEEDGGSGFSFGNMAVRIASEEEADDPVSKARLARRDVDERYEDKILALLNPEQKERMPKPEDGQGRGGPGTFISQDAVLIRTSPGGGE